MALIKKTSDKSTTPNPPAGSTLSGKSAAAAPETKAATTAKFEEEPSGDTAVVEETTTATATAAPASTSTAVAAPRANTEVVAAPTLKMMDVIGSVKEQYKVDWNTLDRVQANNGAFLDLGKAKASMGDTIQMRLLSWQDTWQVSPGSDDKEAAEHVRYSDDGKVTKQGEDVEAYLDELRKIYPKAKCDHRCTLVGVLEGSAKDSRLVGELFQIDLSQTSRQEFDKYKISTAYKIGKGLLTADAALLLTMQAEVASAKGRDWTLVKFSPTVLEA